MLNDGRSDHPGGEFEDDEGFRPTRRQIIGAVVAVLLLVFIAVNNQTTDVSFVFFEASLPLWSVLALTAVLAFGIGMLFGSRRTKRKLRSD
ncbi:MAG: LapA family protein [Actinomycetia bacterium]|nr:LapA family protein [Actinomycetes bacterium]